MKISIDTKEDSHEEIKKVIKMLQNLVGESQEIFSNEPISSPQETTSAFNNIFGDADDSQNSSTQAETSTETAQETQPQSEEMPQSTEDLFAELFNEEEIKKMDTAKAKEEEEDEEEETPQAKFKKKFDIEFY